MMQFNNIKKQMGLTVISWAVVLIFVGFQVLMIINIAPVYLTDSSIKSLFAGLENDPTLVGKSPKEIKEVVLKRLKINNVYALKKDDIEIKKVKDTYVVSVWYEPRGRIIGSLDYIVTFEHEAVIRAKL